MGLISLTRIFLYLALFLNTACTNYILPYIIRIGNIYIRIGNTLNNTKYPLSEVWDLWGRKLKQPCRRISIHIYGSGTSQMWRKDRFRGKVETFFLLISSFQVCWFGNFWWNWEKVYFSIFRFHKENRPNIGKHWADTSRETLSWCGTLLTLHLRIPCIWRLCSLSSLFPSFA